MADETNGTSGGPAPGSQGDDDRLDVTVEVFITARTQDGKPFQDMRFVGNTFHQPRIGLSAINRRAVKFLDSLVDLGVQAAVQHDPSLAETLKRFPV